MSEHVPTEIAYARSAADNIIGHTIDCSCGDRGELYSTPVGARLAYMEHVVERVASDADWPETYMVEVDWSYVGDAS